MTFQRLADGAARWAGSRWAFIGAMSIVLGWLAVGPWFKYSDSWSLFINTLTTIVTFLMVFLIQNSQNRGVAALHAKIDELIRATETAQNKLIGLEQKTEEEIVQAAEEVKEAIAPGKFYSSELVLWGLDKAGFRLYGDDLRPRW